MPPFRDQPWHRRFAAGGMGEEAEGAFEQWATHKKVGHVRFGLDRPPLAVHLLPLKLRYMPDYLMTRRFVECKGYGGDGVLKIKEENLEALTMWSDDHPVSIFTWHSPTQQAVMVDLDDLMAVWTEDVVSTPKLLTYGEFSDNGKPWVGFPTSILHEFGELL